jgi:cytochrome c553
VTARRWRPALTLAVALLILGAMAVVSGVVPITASSGHWKVTASFLHFAMRRSVATHALGVEVPSLDEPWLAVKGAAHYETACRDCHGSPQHPLPVRSRHMTPRPPDLSTAVPGWKPAELFYIVKHGVKFTGMPAWPAPQREDEVWAMVAFLRRLPELDGPTYLRLAGGPHAQDGDAAPPPQVARSCVRCHDRDGQERETAAFPKLDGQRPAYLLAALQAFARGERHSGIMGPIAASLRAGEMDVLARHYGGVGEAPPPPAPPERTPGPNDAGERIAHHGLPAQRVPACVACHGPRTGPRNPAYPVLGGQHAEYLELQLELFAQDRRGGSPYGRLMRPVASRLTRDQMRAVARYYASLGGGARSLDPR